MFEIVEKPLQMGDAASAADQPEFDVVGIADDSDVERIALCRYGYRIPPDCAGSVPIQGAARSRDVGDDKVVGWPRAAGEAGQEICCRRPSRSGKPKQGDLQRAVGRPSRSWPPASTCDPAQPLMRIVDVSCQAAQHHRDGVAAISVAIHRHATGMAATKDSAGSASASSR